MIKNIQLPLIQDPVGELITVKLYDITPVEDLDCQEPDTELITMIAESWVAPIIICPDNRFEGENGKQLYYPIDGKRRVKAVAYLANLGYEFHGVPVENMDIQAVLRRDLLPENEASYKLAFQANNLRSANPITDVNAIKATAASLGVDVFTKEGRCAVAKVLHSSPQAIARLAKGIDLADTIYEAYQHGRISRETLMAIGETRDVQARVDIAKRLEAGEEISKKDVLTYNKQVVQTELLHSNETRPEYVYTTSGSNPLNQAISLLTRALGATRTDKTGIQMAIELLNTLL